MLLLLVCVLMALLCEYDSYVHVDVLVRKHLG